MQHDAIAVVDFGGQYAHLIATKIRHHGVLAEIRQPEDPIEAFERYRGLVLSGSPSLSSQGEDANYTKAIFDLEVPLLGFCFGHQEIAKHYGGEVEHGGRQWGKALLHLTGEHALFDGQPEVQPVWMSHYDSVVSVGEDFKELGFSQSADGAADHRFAAIGSDSLRRYGFQFHPEVDATKYGDDMIRNFVLEICGCRPTWSMDAYIEEELEVLRKKVGEDSVFLLASGGVDSTVAAALLGRALGPEQLHLLHIDNGLMRKNESAGVLELFKQLGLDAHLHFVDATETFLEALEGATKPEHKRRIIGDTFVRVFQEQARRLGIEGHLLGQGTIYPDTIESGGTKRSDTIKTHHNRVPVIEQMIAEGKVVEPLADLYKVEVRELGEKLGIEHSMVWRHPFPGPGLGVRLLCNDGVPDDSHFEAIEPVLPEVAQRFGLEALVLPIRSVGVKADLRAYEHPVLLSGDVAFEQLLEATALITSEVPHVNRCVWNLGPSAPRTARPIQSLVTRERLDVLREADQLVMDGLVRHGLYDEIWQCPTVLVPLDLDESGGELVILRPISSTRAMTAQAVMLPGVLLDELRQDLLALPGVGALALDVTSKPPGTIEWE